MPFDFISKQKFTALESFALANPPTWTRLEPQSTTGDPQPGIQARVHDPLWMLGRQWQLGEFEGEDAGTPVTVRVVSRTRVVDRWSVAGDSMGRSVSQAPQDLLESLVEREPVQTRSPGLRPRAEAAAAVLSALVEAGLGRYRTTVISHCPLDINPLSHPGGDQAALDLHWLRLVRLLGNVAMADAETLATEIESAGALPAWFDAQDAEENAALLKIIDPWLHWYRAEVSPPTGVDDCWIGDRLEYRFKVGAGSTVLTAPAHGGGDIDWHTFDPAPASTLPEMVGADPLAETRKVHALLASPLRYAGMPADRFWEMEDAQVNVGLIEAEPWDLARLLVAEFALTYGNDWLVVPVDVPFGSLTILESVSYVTTFGEQFIVRPTTQVSPDRHWRMFTIADASGSAIDGLLIPPGAVAVQDGPAIEEVLFLRDEMANLVWAVERSVQGPSGAARDRAREADDIPASGWGPVTTAALDYQLQSSVPERWIPFLPRTSGYRAVELVQARLTRPDNSNIAPLGRTLNRPDLKKIKDAEIPREGILVRRHFSMTRRSDGSYACWTTRRTSIGRGEGASRLAFDSAISRVPRPNR